MPTFWSRYTPPERTTFFLKCSCRSSSTCARCTRVGDARSTQTPPTEEGTRSVGTSRVENDGARVASRAVFARTPPAPPVTRVTRRTSYAGASTNSAATRSNKSSGMLSNAPLTSAATMNGFSTTGSGPAIERLERLAGVRFSSFSFNPGPRSNDAPSVRAAPFVRSRTSRLCLARHRRMNGTSRACTSW